MTVRLPVACLHARSATSLASEPACPRYTRRSPLPGTSASRSSARPTESGCTADSPPEPGAVRTARLTASTTAGWPCPSPHAVQVADRSSSSRPSGVTRVEPWPGHHLEREEPQLLDARDDGFVPLVERAHDVKFNSAVSDSPTRLAIPEAASAITNPTMHQYRSEQRCSGPCLGVLDVEPQHHHDHHRAEQWQHQTEHLALAAVHVDELRRADEPRRGDLDQQVADHQAHRTGDGEQEVGVDRGVAGAHVGPAERRSR